MEQFTASMVRPLLSQNTDSNSGFSLPLLPSVSPRESCYTFTWFSNLVISHNNNHIEKKAPHRETEDLINNNKKFSTNDCFIQEMWGKGHM